MAEDTIYKGPPEVPQHAIHYRTISSFHLNGGREVFSGEVRLGTGRAALRQNVLNAAAFFAGHWGPMKTSTLGSNMMRFAFVMITVDSGENKTGN